MTNVVAEIFDKLGGATAIARGIGSPVQTVHSWSAKANCEIPPWRRSDILMLAGNLGKLAELSSECLEYLQSKERRTAA